jgi:hypothetical protein
MARCQLCRREPAQEVTLRRQVGMLILMRTYKFKGWLCREHALEHGNDWLKKTLVLGWWGFFSFFVNFFVIGTDLLALSRAKKMAPPGPPPPETPKAPETPATPAT